jgi:hypothetical protein
MSLWGNTDFKASPGTVDLVSNSSGVFVANSAGVDNTFFANNYAAGDVINITDAGGEAVILSITNSSFMTLVSNTEFTVGNLTGKTYAVSEKPKYVVDNGTTDANEVFGVDVAEMAAASNTGFHAGWVKRERYTDTHGNVRTKTETLVASSSIGSDAADDSEFPDS